MALDFRSDIELTNVKTLPLNGTDKVNVNQKVSLQNMMPLAGGIDLKTILENETLRIKFFEGAKETGYKLNINNLVSVGRYFCNATANRIIAIGDSSGDIITAPVGNTGLIFEVIVSNKIGDMTHDKPSTIDSSWRYYMQTLRVHDNITIAGQQNTDACIVEWRRHIHDSISDKGHEWTFGNWQKCIFPVTQTETENEYTFLPNFKSNKVTADEITAEGTIEGATIQADSIQADSIGIQNTPIHNIYSNIINTNQVTAGNQSGYGNNTKKDLFGSSGILADIDTRLKNLGFKGGYDIICKPYKDQTYTVVAGRVAQIGTIVYGYISGYLMLQNSGTSLYLSPDSIFTLPNNVSTSIKDVWFTMKCKYPNLNDICTCKISENNRQMCIVESGTYQLYDRDDAYVAYFWYETVSNPTIDNAKEKTITQTVTFAYTGSTSTQTHYTDITVSDFIVENSTITAEFTDSTVAAIIKSCSRKDAHTIHIKIVDQSNTGKNPRYEVKLTYTYDTNIH